MKSWMRMFLASSVVGLSCQVARFMRLPAGYYVTSSTEPTVSSPTNGLKNCSVKATIEDLVSGGATHYSFDEAYGGVCSIYSSFDIIGKTEASDPVVTLLWYIKLPDNVSYDGKCDDHKIAGLIEVLNSTTSVIETSTVMQTTVVTTPITTTRTTPRTTKPTTPKPKPCKATKTNLEARIYLDYTSGIKVFPAKTAKKSVECVCNNNARLKQQFWNSAASPTSEAASLEVTCTNKAALCIIPEQGSPWVPAGKPPPDGLTLFPYCEANRGCQMYLLHYTQQFTSTGTDLVTGFLGAVLAQPGKGGGRFNEAKYYVPNSWKATGRYAYKPRGYTSVYIKAAAISCGGCANVKKYATFTCPLPSATG